jgi:transposase-like protein
MRAPVLAVGDGALGFWKALREVFPETKEQRCWWHKIGNVNPLRDALRSAARSAGLDAGSQASNEEHD